MLTSNTTNSNRVATRAQNVLDQLCAALGEHVLQRDIDGPVDEATERFMRIEMPIDGTVRFHRLLSLLVRWICTRGLRMPRRVSPPIALAEGIMLLDQGYVSGDSCGYDAALPDTLETADASPVISCIAEAVKTRERGAYTQWVIASFVDPLDWASKCALVEAYMRLDAEFIPEHLRSLRSARLAPHLSSLIEGHVAAEQRVAAQLAPPLPGFLA